MNVTSTIPIVTTSRLAATRAFYVDLLGFEPTFENEHYLGVRANGPGSPELGFMHPDAMAPDVFDGRGMSIVLNVPDADREYGRLFAKGAPVKAPPQDMPWGSRCFSLLDPNGVALVIAHPIPMALEFQAFVR